MITFFSGHKLLLIFLFPPSEDSLFVGKNNLWVSEFIRLHVWCHGNWIGMLTDVRAIDLCFSCERCFRSFGRDVNPLSKQPPHSVYASLTCRICVCAKPKKWSTFKTSHTLTGRLVLCNTYTFRLKGIINVSRSFCLSTWDRCLSFKAVCSRSKRCSAVACCSQLSLKTQSHCLNKLGILEPANQSKHQWTK